MNEIRFLRHGVFNYFHGIHKCVEDELGWRLQEEFKTRASLRRRFFRSENWHGMFS